MLNLRDFLLIAVCGALGAVGRHALGSWTHLLLGPRFAYGTLVVNVVGCLLLGALHAATSSAVASHQMRVAIGIGFLGAFTTFSTFGVETFIYLEGGDWWLAFGNVAANVVFGLAAVWCGMTLVRAAIGAG